MLSDLMSAPAADLDPVTRETIRLARVCGLGMDPRWFVTFDKALADRTTQENLNVATIAKLRAIGDVDTARNAEIELASHRDVTEDMRTFRGHYGPAAA